MKKHYSVKLKDAAGLAKKIVKELQGGEILALIGPLGSGKTTFTKALAKQLGIKHGITSPTFILMNEFDGLIGEKPIHVHHLDLYRTESEQEVLALGLQDFWGHPNSLTVIEWADKITGLLPSKTITIHFSHE